MPLFRCRHEEQHFRALDARAPPSTKLVYKASVHLIDRPQNDAPPFRIVRVDLEYMGNGDVVGDGPVMLNIARENGNHFVPLERAG